MSSRLQDAPPAPEIPPASATKQRSTTTTGQLVKVAVLGLVVALAIFGALPLVSAGAWGYLTVLLLVTALLVYVYVSPRHIPAKYLVPGTLLLIAFQLFPVFFTLATAFTNYGDGHRGDKEGAIAAIEAGSLTQVEGSEQYGLTLARQDGDLVFLLVNGEGTPFVGTAEGVEELDPDDVELGAGGRITAADGFELLNAGQASSLGAELGELTVPVDGGAIRASGFSSAFELVATRAYDPERDAIVDASTGQAWTADEEVGYFVDEDGANLPQGWRVGVGLDNFIRVLTDPGISGPFLGILLWNLTFAAVSVLITFAGGLFMAVVLNHPRLRGQRLYRSLLILPYAMPAFAMLLVWQSMFNRDFGLVNNTLGLDVNWLGDPWLAKFAILLVQLWMGYPYMFLVATGALQAIPGDLTEAANVDGAKPWYAFRTVTFPLLLVALSPLLITSFAFNFNNFNAIYLLTQGGPFSPDSPGAGSTDILITYTYRLAFGGSGAQFGFAAAISVVIFAIVAIISIIGFRQTRALEEVNR